MKTTTLKNSLVIFTFIYLYAKIFIDFGIFFLGLPKKGSDLKEGGDAVDGQDPTKLEGQPAVNGEPEKR